MKEKLVWCLTAIVLSGCAPAVAPFSVDPSHPASPQAAEAPLPSASEALRPIPSAGKSQEETATTQHMHHGSGNGSARMDMGGMNMGGSGTNADKHEMK